ncbi:MAG: hypothetical protein OXF66_00785 [Gammaproteobacteria bacterium]|nr:hypothetical protein [Gammaproteobacteria bacterium]
MSTQSTNVPFLAMSGGAMISLASDVITLGRQSQLGPIDPQLLVGNQWRSARAIQEAFMQAKTDIEKNTNLAHLWAPMWVRAVERDMAAGGALPGFYASSPSAMVPR